MSALYLFLNENGLMLLSGITIIMLIGTLVTLIFRAPILKQRTAEFTILGSILWLALASIPLPRYDITPLISNNVETIQDKETGEPNTEPAIQPSHSLEQIGEIPTITEEKPETSPDDQSLVLGELTKEQLKLLEEISTQDQDYSLIRSDDAPEVSSIENSPINNEPVNESPLVQSDPEITVPESEAGLPVPANPTIPEIAKSETNLSEPEPASAWMTGLTNWFQENLSVLKNRMTEIYLVGFVMTFFWLMVGQFSLYRLKRKARKADQWIMDIYQNLDEVSGLRNATLLISSETDRAMTFGVRNPVILLPQSLCTEENRPTVKQVLLHERAHVQRYDALGRVLFNLAFPLFYFHPLFWWLRTSSYHSAELVADEAAALQSSRTEYAEALVSLIKNHPQRTVMMNNAMPIFKTPSSFYRRMETLVTRTKNLETRLSRFWKVFGLTSFAVVLLATTSVLGIRQLQAEPEPKAVVNSLDENPTEEKKESSPVEDSKTEKAEDSLLEAKNKGLISEENQADQLACQIYTVKEPFCKRALMAINEIELLFNFFSNVTKPENDQPLQLILAGSNKSHDEFQSLLKDRKIEFGSVMVQEDIHQEDLLKHPDHMTKVYPVVGVDLESAVRFLKLCHSSYHPIQFEDHNLILVSARNLDHQYIKNALEFLESTMRNWVIRPIEKGGVYFSAIPSEKSKNFLFRGLPSQQTEYEFFVYLPSHVSAETMKKLVKKNLGIHRVTIDAADRLLMILEGKQINQVKLYIKDFDRPENIAKTKSVDTEEIRQLQVDNLLKLMKTDGTQYEIRYTVRDMKSLFKINEMIGNGEISDVEKSKGIKEKRSLKYQDFTTTAKNHGKIYQKLLDLEPVVFTEFLTTILQSYSVPKENWRLVSHMLNNPVIEQYFEKKKSLSSSLLGEARSGLKQSPKVKIIFNEKRNQILVVGTPSDQERIQSLIEYLSKPSEEVSGVPYVLFDYQYLYLTKSLSELKEQEIVLMDSAFLKADNDDINLARELAEAMMDSQGKGGFLFSHFGYSGRNFIVTRNSIIPKIEESLKQIRALPVSEQAELKKNTKSLRLGLRKKLKEAELTTNPEQKKALEKQVKDQVDLVAPYAKTGEKPKPVEKNPYENDPQWKNFIHNLYSFRVKSNDLSSNSRSPRIVQVFPKDWTEENRKEYIKRTQSGLNGNLSEMPTLKLQLQYRTSRMISNAKLTQVMLFIETPEFNSPSKIVSKKFTEEELIRYQIEQIYIRLTDRAPSQDEMKTLEKIYSKTGIPARFALRLATIIGIHDSDTVVWYECKKQLEELDQVETQTREEMKKLAEREPNLETCYLYYRLEIKLKNFVERCKAAISSYDKNQTKVRGNTPTYITYPGGAGTIQIPKTGPMPVAGQPAKDVKIRNLKPLPIEATVPAPVEEKKKYPFDKEPYWYEFFKMGGANDLPDSYREKEIKGYLTELERIQNSEIPSLKLQLHHRRKWPVQENAISKTIQFIESDEFPTKDSVKLFSKKQGTKEAEPVKFTPEELVRHQVSEIYQSLFAKEPDQKEMEYLAQIYSASESPLHFFAKLLEIQNIYDRNMMAWIACRESRKELNQFEKQLNEFQKQNEALLKKTTLESHFRIYQMNEKWRQTKSLIENSIKNYDQAVSENTQFSFQAPQPATASEKTDKNSAGSSPQKTLTYEKTTSVAQTSTENVDLLKLATKYSDVIQQYQETEALEKILKPKFDAGIPSESDDSYRDKYLSAGEKLKSLRNQIQFLKQLAEITYIPKVNQMTLGRKELSRLEKLHKQGVTSAKELNRQEFLVENLENEVKILFLIMDNKYANEILNVEENKEKEKEESKPEPAGKKAG